MLNNLSVAIDNLVTNDSTTEPDDSLAFTNVLDIANLRSNTTGPLRISLWAQPGYNYQVHLGIDYQFLKSLNAPEQQLAVTNLPGPGTLGPTNSTQITVNGICPPPFYFTNSPSFGIPEVFGLGYNVLAVLEEQTGGVWQTRDSRVIVIGNWLTISNFTGVNGGVDTLQKCPASRKTDDDPERHPGAFPDSHWPGRCLARFPYQLRRNG